MMDDDRWEYRIWSDDAGIAARIVAEAEKALDAEYRTDTYLLTTDEKRLAKIRGGRLFEVKDLIETGAGLERWMMSVSAAFPIDAPAAEPLLGAAEGPLDPRALLALAASKADIVEVRKHRRQFRFGNAQAEITEVMTGERVAVTYGVECPERDDCLRLVRSLGLEGHDNEDYGTFLRRIRSAG